MLTYGIARLQKKLRLSAIRSSQIDKTAVIEAGSQIVAVQMGRHSFCGYDCTILNAEIGGFCSIADSVYIGGSNHPMHFVSTSPVFLSHRDSVRTKFAHHHYSHMPRTTLGHDVWVGHGAKIKAGVSIGIGAVVGMGAVVTRDVKPYEIVAGNPARLIGSRFEREIVEALLKSAWWSLGDEDMRNIAVYFNDPKAYLRNAGLL